jgi:hydroxymethylglutaryl-CoA lyase
MSDLPKRVTFHEEGPREGFQIEKKIYPLADRAALVEALAETGLPQIQVASFVNPKKVPSMADTEQLFAAIKKKPGVAYTGLWLNEQGFLRAKATPGVDLKGKLSYYASDRFAMMNNNCSAAEMRERSLRWLDLYKEAGIALDSATIMVSFGCNIQGDVPISAVTDTVRWLDGVFKERGLTLPKLYLADTVGWANPDSIKRRVAAVREIMPNVRVGLHLHDTRGLGGANFYAALEMGVDLFDSSVAGLGGCPFCGNDHGSAAGNICTEDMVFLCQELGIETGIDLEKLIDASRMAERIIGRTLTGKVMHAGSLAKFRAAARQAAAE